MASETVDQPDEEERDQILVECSYEIDGLASALRDMLPEGNALEPEHYAWRVIADRLRHLACIVLTAAGEPDVPNASLRERLTGEREEVAHG